MERSEYIGGPDAAAICGVSPYRTALDVFKEKTGETPPVDLSENLAVQAGVYLEQFVLDEYLKQNSKTVILRDKLVKHPAYNFIAGHPDALTSDKIVVEIKTSLGKFADKMWAPGVPDYYAIQCYHYLEITGADYCDLVVMLAGPEIKTYRIESDKKIQAAILNKCVLFWDKLQKNIRPEPSTLPEIKQEYRDDRTEIAADSKCIKWIEEIKTARKYAEIGEQAKISLMNYMKNASELIHNGKKLATFREGKAGRRLNVVHT